MPMNENVIALRFTDRAAAYQALSGLKHLSAANAEVRGAVLIERLEGGTVRVTKGVDGAAGREACACITQAPRNGAVVLTEVGEAGTDTLDMLALWYGAVLERIPVDSVRGGLQAVEGGVSGTGKEWATRGRDGERADAARKSQDVAAMLRRTSAA